MQSSHAKSVRTTAISLPRPRIRKGRRLLVPPTEDRASPKTHFKDIIELSQDLTLNDSPRPSEPTLESAKKYIEGKLSELRERRVLGMRVGCNELERDPKLTRSLSRAAKEVVDVYQLRRPRDQDSVLLLKGQGKLVWNQHRRYRSDFFIQQ